MTDIYTLTVLNDRMDARTWLWLPSFEAVEREVLLSPECWCEGFYEYAVIERVPPGFSAKRREEWWYRFYPIETPTRTVWKARRIEKPAEFHQVGHFGLG